jgi:transposase
MSAYRRSSSWGFHISASHDSTLQEALQRRPHWGEAALSAPACRRNADSGQGYDSDEFRNALAAKDVKPCIPPEPNRIADTGCDEDFYQMRGRIEIMFGRLKDWRRIAMGYDRFAHTFFSAICMLPSPSSGSDQC